METVNITINDTVKLKARKGRSVKEILKEHFSETTYSQYSVVLNGQLSSLNTIIEDDIKIMTVENCDESSRRAYENTAALILTHTTQQIFPEEKLIISHSICEGLFCEFYKKKSVDDETVQKLINAFNDIIKKNLEIKPFITSRLKAIKYFKQIGRNDSAELLKYSNRKNVLLYTIEEKKYWLPGPPAPNTGLIKIFSLQPYSNGFVLRYPIEPKLDRLPVFTKQNMLCQIFNEAERWGEILEITDISHVNRLVVNKKISDMIKISEALHEKKIAIIADSIAEQNNDRRLIFIAGPSSSGKTTFMMRLYIQLRVLGYKVVTLSIDNYFLNRDEIINKQRKNINYEVLEAIDLDLLNSHLSQLLSGKPVSLPKYDFKLGKKNWGNNEIIANKKTLFIIEGIHGLNPGLTNNIDDSYKYKIYISALTHLNFDNSNRISTHDARLIRRIVRDYKYRGYSASETIKMWQNVVLGEKKYIFPFQEESDIMFNSSLAYEFGVLKKYAEEALNKVPEDDSSYPESKRLLDFLSYSLPIDDHEISPTSILREFIGKSSFTY